MQGLIIEPYYIPNLRYFSKFLISNNIILDDKSLFRKQSYRNRGYILSANGILPLIVPVCKLYQIRIKRENYETKVYTFESLKQAQKTLAVISLKTKSAPKEENIILTDENNKTIDNPKNVIYKVQICASRVPASTKELKQKYKGDLHHRES